jgi:hypothetical protein
MSRFRAAQSSQSGPEFRRRTHRPQLARCGPLPRRLYRAHARHASDQPPRPAARDRAAAHLRDHLAPRRGQDDADREVPALRRRDPDGRTGARQGRGAAHALGLHEDGAGSRHLGLRLGHVVRFRQVPLQPRRHARPLGFLRGHLSHADRRGRRDHGHRRGQGRGKPDAEAVRGLPPARPADPDLLQQDGPRKPGHVRDHRRDPGKPRHRRDARVLAHRHGARFPRLLRPDPRPAGTDGPRRPQQGRRAVKMQGLDDPKLAEHIPAASLPSSAKRSRWRANCCRRWTAPPSTRAR